MHENTRKTKMSWNADFSTIFKYNKTNVTNSTKMFNGDAFVVNDYPLVVINVTNCRENRLKLTRDVEHNFLTRQ